MSEVISLGRVGVDLYSLDYDVPLKDVERFAKYVGGGAANLAVGLSRLGVRVGVVSGVADDELGEFVIEYLSREKVDTRFIRRFPNSKTGLVFAEVYPGSTNSKFIFYRENAADLKITAELVDDAAVEKAKVLVTNGTALSANPSREAALHAMRAAKEHERDVVFNLDWRPSLWGGVDEDSKLSYYASAVGLASVVIGNDAEYIAATSVPNADDAVAQIQAMGDEDRLLIRTRGELGTRAYAKKGEPVVDAPPYRVTPLKTLGAGDGNLAGIIYGRLKGWDLYRTLRFGSAIGAIVVTKHSCSDAMPTYDEAMSFVEKMGGF